MGDLVPLFAFALADLLPYILAVVAAAVLIGFLLVSAIFSVWLERKVAGRIQDRLGPTRVGGKFGWLQTLADGMKLLVKEDLIPAAADHMLFRLGPYIALAGSFMAYHRAAFRQWRRGPRDEHRHLLHARHHVDGGLRHHPHRLWLGKQMVAVRRHARGGPDGEL